MLLGSCVLAAQTDYEQIYRELEKPDFSYVHNIDPGEMYDIQHTSWSPYPLFRLTSPLYFKDITIEPGYYLLTPRQHKGNWYILFKEQGQVKYIIPAYNREIVPMGFYDENLPKQKLTPSQKFQIKFFDFVGKYVRSSWKKTMTSPCFLRITRTLFRKCSMMKAAIMEPCSGPFPRQG